jgi:Na+/proline symporter/signal transduction histidine kinase
MTTWAAAALALAFIGGLFAVASWGEQKAGKKFIQRHGRVIYSLALAVYCTSWTYYGAVGTAVTEGWDYIPIYLGPILIFLFAQPFLQKLLSLTKKHNITSIADFIAARYGKRRHLALLVTLLCLMVVIPYIALQLKAVSNSYQVLQELNWETNTIPPWLDDAALPIAIAMAFFAILFGTQNVNLTKRSDGVILAVAFESLVKLLVLIILAGAVYVVFLRQSGPVWSQFYEHAAGLYSSSPEVGWVALTTKTLLSMAAIFLLPRQFHVAFTANAKADHLGASRYWFTLYLLLVTLVAIPIAVAGMNLFPEMHSEADSFVLRIPASSDWDVLTLLVFIGGFSAATSMIIIATLALSTMLSNDVVMFMLLRRNRGNTENIDYRRIILPIRRLTVITVMLLSWIYYVIFARDYDLAETGLLTFALIAQLAPAVIGGLYWRHGNVWGVYAGLICAVSLWFYTLMLPQLISINLFDGAIMVNGLFGYSWLHPQALFGIQLDSLSHGVLASFSVNVAAYIGVSLTTSVPLQDRLQAAAFTKPSLPPASPPNQNRSLSSLQLDLFTLLERFTGEENTHQSLNTFTQSDAYTSETESKIKADRLIRPVERELAGVIGAPSASVMIKAVIEGTLFEVEDVVTLFDDTSRAIQFSRKILTSTLEHLSQGVSVVDRSLDLVAWNKAYLEMFNFPPGMIRIGRPIAEIIRFNAERGLYGRGDHDVHVQRRLKEIGENRPHVSTSVRPDGTVLEIRGNPIPGGGFVISFTDITEYTHALRELAEAKEHLEQRVLERTETISKINQELVAEIERHKVTENKLMHAKAEAETANASKTRFLALASHDILQPLNAARLFTEALSHEQSMATETRVQTLHQLDSALNATEELISTLLEIAQLDEGKLSPSIQQVNLDELMSSLIDEYRVVAQQKNLELRVVGKPGLHALSDATYLRRILQNLISNAVKYTQKGHVLLSWRKRGHEELLIQVWDTGPGIPEEEHEHIFTDFYRLTTPVKGQPGIGLGLAVVLRMARMLGLAVEVRSRPGHGSVFSIRVKLTDAKPHAPLLTSNAQGQALEHLSVICVDDDEDNNRAMESLLKRWGITSIVSFQDGDSAVRYASTHEQPDVVIIDYQLSTTENGLDVYERLQAFWPQQPGILVSAAPIANLGGAANVRGLHFLPKPIKPAALRAFMTQITLNSSNP